MELRPHQKEAVRKLDNGKILYGDVGTGKSLTAAAYYIEREAPKDVYVITTAKKRDTLDWEKDFTTFGVGKEFSVAGKLVIDSWNNIKKYVDVKDAFFVFDEQRLVGSGAWTKSFLKIASHNRWILLTATPGDTWLDYIPVFIANGHYKNRTQFKREHVVYASYSKFPKVERYVAVGKLVRLRNEILVEMPYDRHTVRHLINVAVQYDLKNYKKVVKDRWNPFKDQPIMNSGELFSVMRKVVNSDPSRVEAVRGLMEKHPRLVVFYNFDYELESLRCLANHESSPASTTTTPSSSSRSRAHPTVSASGRTSTPEVSLDSTSRRKVDAGSRPRRGGDTNLPTPPSTRFETSTPEVSCERTTRVSSSASLDEPSPRKISRTSSNSASSSRGSETDSATGTTTFQVAEWNGHRHDPLPTGDRWVYLVQYVAGSEGWNCTTTDAMVLYSLTYSYKNYHQALGRIDRLDTPYTDLNYYTLLSNAPIDQAVWKALRSKKSFNEKRYYPKAWKQDGQPR